MPPTQEFIHEQYPGISMQELSAQVDNAIAFSKQRISSVDGALAYRILENARIHLTDYRASRLWPVKSDWPVMDDFDKAAYNLVEEVQFCVEKKLTRICRHCGAMQGMHSRWGDYCRREGIGAQLVSNYFEAVRP